MLNNGTFPISLQTKWYQNNIVYHIVKKKKTITIMKNIFWNIVFCDVSTILLNKSFRDIFFTHLCWIIFNPSCRVLKCSRCVCCCYLFPYKCNTKLRFMTQLPSSVTVTEKRMEDGLYSFRAITFLVLWYFFSGCTLFLNKYILSYLNGDPTVLGKYL